MSCASHSAWNSRCYHYWLENAALKEVSGPSLTVAQDTVDGSEVSGGRLVQDLPSFPPGPGDFPPFGGPCPGRAQGTGKMARKLTPTKS